MRDEKDNQLQARATPDRRPLKRRLWMIGAVILLGATSVFAFGMPVFDAANFANNNQIAAMQSQERWQQFFQNLNLAKEVYLFQQNWRKWEEMLRGHWFDALNVPDATRVASAMGGYGRTDDQMSRLGWSSGRGDADSREVLNANSLKALDDLQNVIDARPAAANVVVRDDLRTIYGPTPATRPDIENAYRAVGRAAANLGELNRAIDERTENIKQLKEQIESGDLAPGDLERLQVMIAAEEQELNTLNVRAQMVHTEVQIAQTGLVAAREGDRERARQRAVAESFDYLRGSRKTNAPQQ